MRRTIVPAVTAAFALAATTLAPSATAAPESTKTLAKNLVTPLSAAVAGNGDVYVAEAFAGELTRVRPGAKQKVVWSSPGHEVSGVSFADGAVTFATTHMDNHTALVRRLSDGKVRRLADVGAYESESNPDGAQEYGFLDLDAECEAQFPEENPPSYLGIVESHPYGTAVKGKRTYLADAAANAVLKIAPDGTVGTVAVLPTVPLTVPEGAAGMFGFPSCVEGHDYHLEPVPTDVEVGPDGDLYVTSLPGGPEGVAANGSVFKVDLPSGEVSQVATGFTSATGVAVAKSGALYVAELFGGRISKVRAGGGEPQTFVSVGMPAAVEISEGNLYATTDAMAEGPSARLVRYGL